MIEENGLFNFIWFWFSCLDAAHPGNQLEKFGLPQIPDLKRDLISEFTPKIDPAVIGMRKPSFHSGSRNPQVEDGTDKDLEWK